MSSNQFFKAHTLFLVGNPEVKTEPIFRGHYSRGCQMGLMHSYVIQCMRVRLGGIAKKVPPFFRECVFHFYILATNIPL